jgi:hypothetical protein
MVVVVIVVILAFKIRHILPIAAEDDRLAMWRVQVATTPMLRRLSDLLRCQRRLPHQNGFEGGEPLTIIGGFAVLTGSLRMGPDLLAKNLDPFGPAEHARARKRQGRRKRLGVPRWPKPGTSLSLAIATSAPPRHGSSF